jgi:hypothetical protein
LCDWVSHTPVSMATIDVRHRFPLPRQTVFPVRYALRQKPLGIEHIMHRPRRFFAGLSPRRPGYDPWLVHMRFMLDKVAMGPVLLPVLRFPLSVSFHRCCILIRIYILLLLEGQTGGAWEPLERQCCFGNRGPVDRKEFSHIIHQIVFCVCCDLKLKKQLSIKHILIQNGAIRLHHSDRWN